MSLVNTLKLDFDVSNTFPHSIVLSCLFVSFILSLSGLEIYASYYILYFTSRLFVMYVRHLFYSCFCFKSGQVSQKIDFNNYGKCLHSASNFRMFCTKVIYANTLDYQSWMLIIAKRLTQLCKCIIRRHICKELFNAMLLTRNAMLPFCT